MKSVELSPENEEPQILIPICLHEEGVNIPSKGTSCL